MSFSCSALWPAEI